MKVVVLPQPHQIRLGFFFHGEQFDPWSFNIGARISADDDTSLEGLGLLLAARSVDSFTIRPQELGNIEVWMTKKRTYPQTAPAPRESRTFTGPLTVGSASQESIRMFVGNLQAFYPESAFPAFLNSAGRLIDMLSAGEYDLCLALDDRGQVAGGILWNFLSDRAVECCGPYLFGPELEACAQDLMDAVINRIAKTSAVCLVSRWATPDVPHGTFEVLGKIHSFTLAEGMAEVPVLGRFLKEDEGLYVWTTPELEKYLGEQYGRLCIARRLLPAREEGERRRRHSVIAAHIDQQHQSALLTLALDGEDLESNILQQVASLLLHGVCVIHFELDLASAQKARLAPILMRNGFEPRLVLPHAGAGDIVLLEKVLHP